MTTMAVHRSMAMMQAAEMIGLRGSGEFMAWKYSMSLLIERDVAGGDDHKTHGQKKVTQNVADLAGVRQGGRGDGQGHDRQRLVGDAEHLPDGGKGIGIEEIPPAEGNQGGGEDEDGHQSVLLPSLG